MARRHASLEGGSLAGSRSDPQAAVEQFHALPDAHQAESARERVGVVSLAVVADADPDLVLDLGYGDRDGLCIGVLQGVPERLLCDSIDRSLHIWMEALRRTASLVVEVHLELERGPAAVRVPRDKCLHGGHQPEVVQGRGPDVVDDVAQPVDLALEGICGSCDRGAQLSVVIAARQGEHHAHGGDALQRLVVQLPCPVATLGFSGGGPLALALRAQRLCGRDGDGGGRRERRQELLIGGAELRPAR